MVKSKYKIELDDFEKEVEKQAERYISVTPKEKKQIENILKSAKKTKNINLRMTEYVLEELKLKARSEAIPYQSYINSILHKYITGQLVDRNNVIELLSIKKSLEERELLK